MMNSYNLNEEVLNDETISEIETSFDEITDFPIKLLWTPTTGNSSFIIEFADEMRFAKYMKKREYLQSKLKGSGKRLGTIKLYEGMAL